MRRAAISGVLVLLGASACERQDFTGPLIVDAAPDVHDAAPDAHDAAPDAPAPPADAEPDAAPALPASCKDAHAHDPAVPTGFVTIDTDGPGLRAPLRVLCDMDTAGGGWTLVARSMPAAQEAFGWASVAGFPAGPYGAYSLSPHAVGLAFSSVLVGARHAPRTSTEWAFVYELPLDAAFVDGHASSSASIEPVAIKGCGPGVPSFLRHAGYSARAGSFFFRDSDDSAGTSGLTAKGWSFAGVAPPDGVGCATYGGLYGAQGMIMVR